MGFFNAVRFLTVLPLPAGKASPKDLGDSVAFFPLVGLFLGLGVAGLDSVLRLVWPASVASAAVVVVMILLTGGLHLDGLMDCCDGLFGSDDPRRRLEIMRDSRVGSFAVLGVLSLLLLKYLTLDALADPWRVSSIVAMPVLGRWAMVLAIRGFPYARSHGLGQAFKRGAGWPQVIIASAIAVVFSVGVLRLAGLAVLLTAALATWLQGTFICSRIPGLTGDAFGAINEVIEVLSLLVILTWASLGYG